MHLGPADKHRVVDMCRVRVQTTSPRSPSARLGGRNYPAATTVASRDIVHRLDKQQVEREIARLRLDNSSPRATNRSTAYLRSSRSYSSQSSLDKMESPLARSYSGAASPEALRSRLQVPNVRCGVQPRYPLLPACQVAQLHCIDTAMMVMGVDGVRSTLPPPSQPSALSSPARTHSSLAQHYTRVDRTTSGVSDAERITKCERRSLLLATFSWFIMVRSACTRHHPDITAGAAAA